MMKVSRYVAAATALTTLSAPLMALAADDNAKLIEYVRRKQNLPPNAAVTVEGLTDSPIKGAKSATINANGQKTEVTMSPDGRYVVFGKAEDITVDPFKAIAAKLDAKGQPVQGGKNAKVTIVEFSDFQCPYCAKAHNILAPLLKEYGDKVRLVYRNFPLGFHKWAEPAGIAGECVFEQDPDAFWKVYDGLFAQQAQLGGILMSGDGVNWEKVKEKTNEFVAGTKVDAKKLAECIDGKKTAELVRGDMSLGQSVGVTGTPAFFINGRNLVGAQPAEKFKAIIDDELARP